MADQTEKPKLGTRPPLGLKRTVETGKVKQSFSHGRSNTVVVEVKKRRILGRPGEAPPPEAPKPEPVAEAPKPAPKPAAPAPQPKRTSPADDITARKEMQDQLLREAEEARLASLEEARRRDDRKRRSRARTSAAVLKRTAKPKKLPPRKLVSRPRKKPSVRPSRSCPAETPQPQVAEREAEDRAVRRPGGHAPAPRRPEPARPTRGRGDDRRHHGKLTVTRALSDEDDSRARSLAALRRAREKEKRAHQQSGPAAKQYRDVDVPEAITVQELAKRMGERGADLVKSLFKMGTPVTITETIDQDTATADRRVRSPHRPRERGGRRHRYVRPTSMPMRRCSRVPRWSRSWAMSTTARHRCWTRSAARRRLG